MVRKFTDDSRFFVINDTGPLRIVPALAMEIGLNESIMLLQMEFWGVTLEGKEIEGEKWIFKSIGEMRDKEFSFWSIATIHRTLKSLEDQNLLLSRHDLNRRKGDQTKWYRINFEECENLQSIAVRGVKNGTIKMKNGTTHTPTQEEPIYQNDSTSFQDDYTNTSNCIDQSIKMTTPIYQNEMTIPESTSESTSEKENSDFFNSSLGQGTEPLHPSPTPTTLSPSSLPISGEEKIRSHLLNRVRVVPPPTTPIPLSSLSVREVLLIPLDKFPNDSEDCPPGWSYKKDAPKRREDLTEEYVRNLYKYENGLKRTLGEKNVCQSREETITFLEALWEPKKATPQSTTTLPHPKALGGMLRQLGKEKSMP